MAKNRKIALDKASAAELRKFATLNLGLEVAANASAEAIRALIKNVYQGEEIMLAEDAPAPDQKGAPPPATADRPASISATAITGRGSGGDPKVEITLNEQDGAGGKRAVPVGVNGSVMLIPRNKRVAIPYRYFLALQNAVQTSYHQETGPEAEITSAEVPAYPFTVHSMPGQAEIDEWNKRTAGLGFRADPVKATRAA